MDDKLMTTLELCEWLKISRTTAWKWRAEGMPHIGAGKRLRYRKTDVEHWLNNRKSEQKGSQN